MISHICNECKRLLQLEGLNIGINSKTHTLNGTFLSSLKYLWDQSINLSERYTVPKFCLHQKCSSFDE